MICSTIKAIEEVLSLFTPELVTTVVGSVGGVEGEWFGGAAINNREYAV